jgi:hypothetical protein
MTIKSFNPFVGFFMVILCAHVSFAGVFSASSKAPIMAPTPSEVRQDRDLWHDFMLDFEVFSRGTGLFDADITLIAETPANRESRARTDFLLAMLVKAGDVILFDTLSDGYDMDPCLAQMTARAGLLAMAFEAVRCGSWHMRGHNIETHNHQLVAALSEQRGRVFAVIDREQVPMMNPDAYYRAADFWPLEAFLKTRQYAVAIDKKTPR